MPETLNHNTFIITNKNISGNTSNSSCNKTDHQFSGSCCSNSSFNSISINKNSSRLGSNNSDPIKNNSDVKETENSKSASSSSTLSTSKSKEDEEEDLFLSSTTTPTNKNTTPTLSTQSTFILPSSSSFTSASITATNNSNITAQSKTSTTDHTNSQQNTSSSSDKKTSDILKSTYGIASDHTVNFTNSNSNIQSNQINTSQKSDQLNFHTNTNTNTNTNTTTYSPVTPIGGGVGDSGSIHLTSNSESSISSSSSSSSSSSTTSLAGNFYSKNKKENSNKFKSTMIIDVLNKLYGSASTQNSNVNSSNTQCYTLKKRSQSLLTVVGEHSNKVIQSYLNGGSSSLQPLTNGTNGESQQQQQLVRNGIRKTFNNFYLLNAVSGINVPTTTISPTLKDLKDNRINIYSAKYNINLFNNQIADKNNNLDSKVAKINFKLTQEKDAKLDHYMLTEDKEQECVSFNNEAVILTQTDDLNLNEEKDCSQMYVSAADERRVASYDLTVSTDQCNIKDNTTDYHEEECDLDDQEEEHIQNAVIPASKKCIYTGSKLALYHQKRQRKRLREKAFFSLKKKQSILNKTKNKGLMRHAFEENHQSDNNDDDDNDEDNSLISFSAEGLIQLVSTDQHNRQLTLDCIYTTTDATITSDESSSSSPSSSTEAFNNTSLIVRSNSKTLSSSSISRVKLLKSTSLKMCFKPKLSKKKRGNKQLLLCSNDKALHTCFKSISGTSPSSSSSNSSTNSKCNSLSNFKSGQKSKDKNSGCVSSEEESRNKLLSNNFSSQISLSKTAVTREKEALIGGVESGLFDDLIIDENPSIELNARADDDYDFDYDINEQIKSSDEDFTYSYGDLLMLRQDQQQQQKQVNSASNIISNEVVNDFSNTSKLEEDDEDDLSKIASKSFQILSLIVHRLPGF